MSRPGGKRGEQVPRPVLKTDWTLRFASKGDAAVWAQLTRKYLIQARRFWDLVVEDPRFSGEPKRHHRLLGELASDTRGREQWQHEISSTGARIWFAIDDETHEIWLTNVTLSHPNQTK